MGFSKDLEKNGIEIDDKWRLKYRIENRLTIAIIVCYADNGLSIEPCMFFTKTYKL